MMLAVSACSQLIAAKQAPTLKNYSLLKNTFISFAS